MPGIDVSMYGTPQSQQANPLATVAQFAYAQNALNQNALFQQTYRARQAMGPLAQQSIGPDGQMDYNKFAVLISAHPDTAWMAPDIINGIVQRQLVQADTVQKNLQIAQTRADAMGRYAGAAISDADPQQGIGRDKVMAFGAQLHALHLDAGGNGKDTLTFLSGIGLPLGKDGQPDYSQKYSPTLAYQQLKKLQIAQLTSAENIGNTNQKFEQNFGGGTLTGTRNIYTGKVTPSTGPGIQPGGVVPQTSAPGVPTVNQATGEKGQTLVGQPLPPTPGQGPGIESMMLPGAQDQSRVGQGAPVAPYAIPTQQTDVGPLRAGQLKDTADYVDGLRSTVSGMKDQMLMINEMRSALQKFNPNAGTEARMGLAGLLRTAGASPQVYNAVVGGSPTEALSAAQEFQKLSMQNATEQMINLLKGQGRLAVAEFIASLKNNPNVNMTSEAIGKIFDFTQRIYGLNSHELEAYEKWSTPTAQGGYGRDPVQFRSKWNALMRKSGASLDGIDPRKDLKPLIDSGLQSQINALPAQGQ